MRTIHVGLRILAFLCLLSPATGAYGGFDYTDIHPAGWNSSRAVCVNGMGEVAGYGATGAGERGFLWSSGTLTVLLPPGADSARASWINGHGDVAGTAWINGRPRAFLFRRGVYLDPTPGWEFSEAAYVGEDGAVTGTGASGAFVSRDGAVQILEGFSSVVGANGAGQILGSTENAALLYLPGKGTLTIRPPGASMAVPRGINESGLVAVTSMQSDAEEGFVYSGGFYVFMKPTGWSSSNAMAINNHAQVVGHGLSPSGRRSYLRTQAAYEELSFPTWNATEAVSVNDAGQVAGSGETGTGEAHAFLASPVGAQAGGGAEAGQGAGGGCSMAFARRGEATPTAVANAILLFLPLLFAAAARRGRRGSATPR